MRRDITLNLNGQTRLFTADDTAPLLDILRNDAALTGARFGCGAEQCGACAVLIDGEDKPSCTIEAGACVAGVEASRKARAIDFEMNAT